MKYLIILPISVIFLLSIAACNFLINIPKYNSTITFEGLPADELFWLSSATETITFKVKVKDVSPSATFCATADGTPVTIAGSDVTRDASNAIITIRLTPSLPSMKFEFSVIDKGKEVASKEVDLKFGRILSPDKLGSTALSQDFDYYALKENQTYTVSSSLDIPSGKTLYIRSGVRVKFNSGMGLTVNGTLKTCETMGKPATLTSNSTSIWDGITVKDSGSMDISNVYIENASVGIKVEDQSGGELNVSQSTFRGNSKGVYISSNSGIDSTAVPIIITECTFEHNDLAGIEVENGYVDVENCEFNGNAVVSQGISLPTEPSDIASATGGIVLWKVSDSVLRGNTFEFNNVGVFAYSSYFDMDNNTLSSNYRAGVYLYDSRPEMRKNNINYESATSTTIFATSSVYTSKPICLFVAGGANTTNINYNSFSGGSIGIYIATNTSSDGTQLHLNDNDICNNSSYNFYNDSEIPIDAINNYWGKYSTSTIGPGPTIYPTNTASTDTSHGIVYYDPWSKGPYL